MPTAALRNGDFSGLPPLCDPLTRTAAGTVRRLPATRFPPAGSVPVAQALLAKVPLPTSGGLVQNLLGVEDEVNPMNQFSLKVDHRLGRTTTCSAGCRRFRVDDTQPFGTSSLNEALVPGFGRNGDHPQRERRPRPHPHVRLELAERIPLRLSERARRAGQSQSRAWTSRRCPACRASRRIRATWAIPQVAFGGLFSTIGDPTSFVSRDNRSFELYDNVMLDRGNHHLKFGGYLFHLEFNPVNPTNARGNFTFNGQWTGQRVRRLPARLSERRRRSASGAPTSTAAAPGSTSTARTTGRSNQT